MRIEIRRLDHPTVQLDPFAHVYAEKLCRTLFQPGQPVLEIAVINQRPQLCVLRQPDDFGDRRLVEGGISMNRKVTVLWKNVVMSARLACRRQAFGFAAAVQPRAVKISLRRVVRRGCVIEPATRGVHLLDPDHVEFIRRDTADIVSLARD